MMIRSVLLLSALAVFAAGAQQLKSPDEFLGYALGSRFTPQQSIVEYFRYAAATRPDKIKWEEYGRSYEGKTLGIAIVSATSNIEYLEKIRQNNLALAGMNRDMKADTAMPVIVWLSYNVHGNEASSSEVSMKVVYELASSISKQVERWMTNTVIIIDPCLNPDGRDRYVNWYNSTVGMHPNPDPAAAEHQEPWPGGRGNHYLFDLNRDWAWQTQAESRQRVAKYNAWMPAIHVDFHEQYPGNPYYFAPAAEPFHEVITPWQRSFQNVIGKNHARYFDDKGWLYFTREYFDLFYPAYGDTYPIYNGAIGMTYEQAGHGMAGLAIRTDDDTLTLGDRILHHFTTSLSTVETAAEHYGEINREFARYFQDGISKGSGAYGCYLVEGRHSSRLKPLLDLFDDNGIQWSYARQTSKGRGYNYFTGKEEAVQVASGDVLIPARQPKAALVKVLFEPESLLSDSSTYDITAWALPYAYGLQSWAMKDILPPAAQAPVSEKPVFIWTNSYGYMMEYHALSDAALMARLLNAGVKIRYSEKAFTYGGRKYDPGTLLILRKGNEARIGMIESIVNQSGASMLPVASGFMDSGIDFGSDKVHLVKKSRVAVLTGDPAQSASVGEVWHFFERQLDYPVTLLKTGNPGASDLKGFDVLIIASGSYEFLGGKETSADLRNWVKQGGKLIVMEKAVSALSSGDWDIKKKKEDEGKEEPVYADLHKYGNRERDDIVNNIPGAIYKVELDNTHPLAFGYPDYYFSLKQNPDIYEFSKSGWNVGVIKKQNQVSGFVGSRVKGRIQDGTIIGTQSMGSGQVIFFADDPLFRSFWENGKLMFANAVFLL